LIVMPRCFSSGALSIDSKLRTAVPVFSERTCVIAAVSVTDRADVEVRLGALELLLAHLPPPY
jgi:hypothetical protein